MSTMTFATLASQIQDILENDDTDFVAATQSFITRAENRITRELDSEGLTEYATSNFTASDPFLVIPSNTLIIKNVNYVNSRGSRVSLLLRTKEFTEDYWPVRSSVGTPKYYAKFRNNQIIIAPKQLLLKSSSCNNMLQLDNQIIIAPTPTSSNLLTITHAGRKPEAPSSTLT